MCEKYFKRILIVGVVNEFQLSFFTIHLLVLNALAHTSCSDSDYILLSLAMYGIYSFSLKMSAVHPHAVISQLDFKA